MGWRMAALKARIMPKRTPEQWSRGYNYGMAMQWIKYMAVLILAAGCSQEWRPPVQMSPMPPPKVLVQTEFGLIPMTTVEAAAYQREGVLVGKGPLLLSEVGGDYFSSRSEIVGLGPPSGLSMDRRAGYALPTQYYVRGEHTSRGYTSGEYGRLDNFTPGRHTSTGYIAGHYRGDGNYTRGEHTSRGYIPGHYRAEALPTVFVPTPRAAQPMYTPYQGVGRP